VTKSSRNLLAGLGLLLLGGAGIGAIYGRADLGLLAAALAGLAWQVQKLLAFDRALRSDDFNAFRYGDGVWEQIFSRFRHEQRKSDRNKTRYRTLLREIRKSTNAMPDAAVVIDDNNEIIMSNRAAKQLVGLRPKKDKGQRVDNILRDAGLSELLGSNDFKRSVEIESPLRPGEWLNCRVVPYGVDQKLLLLRDVTERLRLNKMRRDFVANASHELRSPLTVIAGYLDGFSEDEIPPEWRHMFSQMQSQSQRMKHIISELLELSRLESAGPAQTETAVDVASIVASAVKAYRDRDGAPTVRSKANRDLRLLGNPTQIESVVTNLLTNAIRHTPADGEVTVEWRAEGRGAVIEVRDTGEGIAPEHLPRLTERFFRVDRGRARDDGGVGLGLAIVKHILNRHDAELQIESTLGQGTSFLCYFPEKRVTAAKQALTG